MVRGRLPGGAVLPQVYLALDRLCGQYGNNTLRITTRQGFQFHGVTKGSLGKFMRGINEAMATTLANYIAGLEFDPRRLAQAEERLALLDRLRRKYGEQYYRQFWGQMIHRLALSHALGSQKRFVVRTDRPRYQADDQVLLTVEAYDKDFQPLAESAVPGGMLSGELLLPAQAARDGRAAMPLRVPQLRKGLFETRFPVVAGGEHRLRIKDPLDGQYAELTFQVTSLSVERQSAVRNVALQQAIAEASGGKSYDLTTVARLPDEIRLARKTETNTQIVPLWNTWFYFLLVVLLLLGEWSARKWINLP